jgi:mono/diheme cytochrome c family protein
MSNLQRLFILFGITLLTLCGTRAFGQDSGTLYNQKCASCHGKDGGGHTAASANMKVPDLRTKQYRDMSDADMYNSIAHGTKHYAYPHAFLHIGLTDEQVQGLVKYIRLLQSSKKTPETQVVTH